MKYIYQIFLCRILIFIRDIAVTIVSTSLLFTIIAYTIEIDYRKFDNTSCHNAYYKK